MSGATHSFASSLARSKWSEKALDASLTAYFGPVLYQGYAELPGGPTASQAAGKDISINLGACEVTADVKLDHYKSDRLCLEVWSNHEKGKPGWAVKPDFTADYVVYLMPSCQEAFILPYQHLKSVLRANHDNWLKLATGGQDGFKLIKANNGTYTTISLGVPKAYVLRWVGLGSQVPYQL